MAHALSTVWRDHREVPPGRRLVVLALFLAEGEVMFVWFYILLWLGIVLLLMGWGRKV